MALDHRVVEGVRQACERLRESGELMSKESLNQYYETFRDRFGPERLKSLDGVELLETVHDHSNHDSLAYWVEFKNDDEFPTTRFGSIAGGSALKLIIYRRKETGEWTTGSPTKQRTISTDEAIEYAKKHRDQFVRGAEVLANLSKSASEQDYRVLEQEMENVAPDVSPLAWGHKYFHLMFPDRLDDFHSPIWQAFHIVKMLKVPETGRYRAAFDFVELAKELDIPMWWLTASLNERYGRPHRYWRLAVSEDNDRRPPLSLLRENECIAIGWKALGDLSRLQEERTKGKAKAIVAELLAEHEPDSSTMHASRAMQISTFVYDVAEHDLVAVMKGKIVVGICRVTGNYFYQDGERFPHRRTVEWLSDDDWPLPEKDSTAVAFCAIGKSLQNLVDIERRILAPKPPRSGDPPRQPPRLTGIPGRIQSVLDRKSQVILYGPPGTGKTYWAESTARDLAALDTFKLAFDQLDQQQQAILMGDRETSSPIRFCCFHPAYGYEDFLEGYRPEQADGRMTFTLRPGIFRQLCQDAESEPDRRYYLIIDEINRGDIPRIFGELLTILEKNKRGKTLLLPLTGQPFRVPANVFVIGTMNTADRSIALLDTALRRRFGFIELMSDSSVLGNAAVEGIPLGPWLDALNERICRHIGRDARNLQIGHAYFMEGDKPIANFARFARVVQDDVIPLLEEYCYEDHTSLERILGKGLIDASSQCARHELFQPDRQEKLIDALVAECPEIMGTKQAMESEAEKEADADEDSMLDEMTDDE